MENLIWHFPSTDGGDVEGINDAGIETFKREGENSLARECIQNSLDAKFNISNPVRVIFTKFQINTYDIPGYSRFKEIITKAKKFSQNQTNAQSFYQPAEETLSKEKIDVLKISDYNTNGLTGDDNDENGSLFKLTRAKGINSKTGDGGGSFGIGKAASFAISALRTVFYSTLNKDGQVAFVGKACLSSFKESENDIRRAVGLYGKKGEHGVNSIRMPNEISDIFARTEQGTDIFIIGYNPTDSDWAKSLLVSVLNNFWLTIHEGMLEVEIMDDKNLRYHVKKDTLQSLLNSIEDDYESTKLFYASVSNPTKKFETNLDDFGEVELYVNIGKGPRRIQCVRRPLMKIHTIKGLRGMYEDFAGVFIARGDKINDLLRELEPAAHDSWVKKQGNSQKSKDAFDAVDKWIRTSLKELAGERYKNPEEIPDLTRYLPDDIERDDLETFPSNSGHSDENTEGLETANQISVEKKENLIEKNIINRKLPQLPLRENASLSDEINKRIPINEGNGKKTSENGVTPNPDGNTKYIDTSNISVRIYETKLNGNRVYVVRLLSSSNKSGSIKIVAYGDEGSFPIEINSAIDQKGKNYNIGNSEIENIELEAGQPIKITITLANNRRYALGVE